MLKKLIIGVSVVALLNPFIASAQVKTNPVLDKVVSELVAAFNAKDATKLTSLYSEDAVLMPPNMPMIRGKAGIEAHFKKEFAAGEMTMQLTPVESMIAATQGFGIGTSTVTFKHGGTTSETGKYVLVFKRVGADWKIAVDIFNSDQPAPAK